MKIEKWSYKMIDLDMNATNWQIAFDTMGNDGWEFVQVVQIALSTKAIFKKTDVSLPATGYTNQWM